MPSPTFTFWDAELSHAFTGLRVASSQGLGLTAVAGRVSKTSGAGVVVMSASPPHQVLVQLPSTKAVQNLQALEWSPQSTEEMLLIAWEDGTIAVLSMSDPERCTMTSNAPSVSPFCCNCSLQAVYEVRASAVELACK
jgi:hypothetical protein